jgi:hypothetical protein
MSQNNGEREELTQVPLKLHKSLAEAVKAQAENNQVPRNVWIRTLLESWFEKWEESGVPLGHLADTIASPASVKQS